MSQSLKSAYGLGDRDERVFDEVANGVRDCEMNLLDHRRLVHGRDQEVIAVSAHSLTLAAGEADGDEAALACGANSFTWKGAPART